MTKQFIEQLKEKIAEELKVKPTRLEQLIQNKNKSQETIKQNGEFEN